MTSFFVKQRVYFLILVIWKRRKDVRGRREVKRRDKRFVACRCVVCGQKKKHGGVVWPKLSRLID